MTDLRKLSRQMQSGDILGIADTLNILPEPETQQFDDNTLADEIQRIGRAWEVLFRKVQTERNRMRAALREISMRDPESDACGRFCECLGCVARRGLGEL